METARTSLCNYSLQVLLKMIATHYYITHILENTSNNVLNHKDQPSGSVEVCLAVEFEVMGLICGCVIAVRYFQSCC